MTKLSRSKYSTLYGPTTGDHIRLGDTELLIQIERDDTVYGEEMTLGPAGSARDTMGQASQHAEQWPDLVITNAVIFDRWQIIKADIAVKDGKIVKLGKAGNPDTQSGVNIVLGPATEIIPAEGKIVTPGGVSTYEKLYSPRAVWDAIRSGITTIAFGGSGPDLGLSGAAATPGAFHIRHMLQALDGYPVNTLVLGKGNDHGGQGALEQIRAGAAGLTVHEAWGANAESIDQCLTLCQQHDVAALIHPSSLNENGYVEQVIASIKERSTIWIDAEGGTGGPTPDSLKVCSLATVLPASCTVTLPYGVNTLDTLPDLLIGGMNLNPEIPENLSVAKDLVRRGTIEAAQRLHDSGAISIIASPGLGAARSDQIINRAWRAADNMKKQFGRLSEETAKNDNYRARRYLAKYTSNPARALGIFRYVGSIEETKQADLVIWDPAFFGVRPSLVLVGGVTVAANLDLTNAQSAGSWARPQPMSIAASSTAGLAFISALAMQSGIQNDYVLAKGLATVEGASTTHKAELDLNSAMPTITVDPATHEVRADGVKLDCQPLGESSLNRLYNLY